MLTSRPFRLRNMILNLQSPRRVLVILSLVIFPAGTGAQEDAASSTARLSAWVAKKVSERPPGPTAADFVPRGLSDADETTLARRIEEELTELRSAFAPESLDLDGVILFRRFETLATMQLDDIRWRRQPLPRPDSALGTPSEGARLPRDYYTHLITSYTNTPLTADVLRSIAERELVRRHEDIRGVMKTLGRTETLERFFEFAIGTLKATPATFVEFRHAYADLGSGLGPRTSALGLRTPDLEPR